MMADEVGDSLIAARFCFLCHGRIFEQAQRCCQEQQRDFRQALSGKWSGEAGL